MSHKIARLSLDFRAQWSVLVAMRIAAMDARMIEASLKAQLTEMRERLERAAGIAKAAEACAETGHIEMAIDVVLDVEQLIYEVNTLLNAASLMHRLGKDRPGA